MKTPLSVLACTLAAVAAVQAARAPEAWDDISFFGDFAFTSEYIFRGYQQTGPAFQQSLEIGYPVYFGNVYVGAFANEPVAQAGQTSEVDFYGGYAVGLLKNALHLDFGQIYYWYPEGNHNAPVSGVPAGYLRGYNASTETYVGLCGDTSQLIDGVNLNPSLYYYYDWMCDKQTVETSIYYTWEVGRLVSVEGLTLTPRLYTGYETAAKPFGNVSTPQTRGSAVYYGTHLVLDYKLNTHVSLYADFFFAGNYATNADPDRTHNQFLGGQVGVRFGL